MAPYSRYTQNIIKKRYIIWLWTGSHIGSAWQDAVFGCRDRTDVMADLGDEPLSPVVASTPT